MNTHKHHISYTSSIPKTLTKALHSDNSSNEQYQTESTFTNQKSNSDQFTATSNTLHYPSLTENNLQQFNLMSKEHQIESLIQDLNQNVICKIADNKKTSKIKVNDNEKTVSDLTHSLQQSKHSLEELEGSNRNVNQTNIKLQNETERLRLENKSMERELLSTKSSIDMMQMYIEKLKTIKLNSQSEYVHLFRNVQEMKTKSKEVSQDLEIVSENKKCLISELLLQRDKIEKWKNILGKSATKQDRVISELKSLIEMYKEKEM